MYIWKSQSPWILKFFRLLGRSKRTRTHTRVSKRERQCDTFRNLLKQRYYKLTKSNKHNISQYLYQHVSTIYTGMTRLKNDTAHEKICADAAEAAEASTGQNEWPHSNSRNGFLILDLLKGFPKNKKSSL